MTHAVFEEIDRIIAGVGFVGRQASAFIETLQSAVRPNVPLSLQAARRLSQCRGQTVYLFTGFVVPNVMPSGENDGPIGTIALARALHRLGARPTIWVDPPLLDTLTWLAAEARFQVPTRPIHLPTLLAASAHPFAAIAIEKPSWNRAGVMHTFDGQAIRGGSVAIDELFRAWNARRVLTLGIGDRGNEIGFGSLRRIIEELRPEAACCQCGCGQGVVSDTATQLLLPSAVSNWGAYGLAAALAVLSGDAGCMLGSDDVARLLQVSAVRGCVDGLRRRGRFSVDGIPGDTCMAVARELQRRALSELHKSGNQNACA